MVASMSLLISLSITHKTQAHTLIPSENGANSVMIHVTPEDDPIAGEPSTFLLTLTDPLDASYETATVKVSSLETKYEKLLTAKIDGRLVSAEYVFPTQGLYRVELNIPSRNLSSSLVFVYTVQVERGVKANANEKRVMPKYIKGILIIGNALLFVVVLAAFGRKNQETNTK